MAHDVPILFVCRSLRLFAYGLLSVILALFLAAIGLSETQIGLLLTLTLAGDTLISLWLTTHADRIGRRRMLLLGGLLMLLAGAVFAVTRTFVLLLLAATFGVISPSGNEVGPFLAIEQSALSEEVAAERRTKLFAWYNLAGSMSTALGALLGGGAVQMLMNRQWSPISGYRAVVAIYALIGAILAFLFTRLSHAVEAKDGVEKRPVRIKPEPGAFASRRTVLKLAALFSLDAFAGGFVVQTLVAYWFHRRFGVDPALLGVIFFGSNVLAGVSALFAASLAKRWGLLATMVATHVPSNVLLFLVPLMPTLPLAIAVLLLRFSISQMDVPTRQAYTMALVAPAERSAAAGVTGIARTVGAALSPLLASPLYAITTLASWPFFLSGGLKIIYDLLVWRMFRRVKLREGA